MNQDPDTKRKKIRCYKEVELRESEFKKASELDSDEFKNIHDDTLLYSSLHFLFDNCFQDQKEGFLVAHRPYHMQKESVDFLRHGTLLYSR